MLANPVLGKLEEERAQGQPGLQQQDPPHTKSEKWWLKWECIISSPIGHLSIRAIRKLDVVFGKAAGRSLMHRCCKCGLVQLLQGIIRKTLIKMTVGAGGAARWWNACLARPKPGVQVPADYNRCTGLFKCTPKNCILCKLHLDFLKTKKVNASMYPWNKCHIDFKESEFDLLILCYVTNPDIVSWKLVWRSGYNGIYLESQHLRGLQGKRIISSKRAWATQQVPHQLGL